MHSLMWLPLATSVLLCLTASRLGRWLPPATAVPVLTVAALVSALSTGFVLAVAAFVVLAQVPSVAALGHWSVAVVRHGHLVPVAAGVVAGVAVALLSTSAVWRAVRAGRDLALAARLCHQLGPAVAGLVVVQDDIPDAYALAGLRGRVVVSTAMLQALPADERAVLLAHEAAHLSRRHHVYGQIVELAAAANPLLRSTARAVGTAVERWADEVAAAEVGDRRLAARALARAGLARSEAAQDGGRSRQPAARGAALAAVDAHVGHRIRALLSPPPRRRPALSAMVVALTVASGAAVLVTEQVTEARFELAQVAYDHPSHPLHRVEGVHGPRTLSWPGPWTTAMAAPCLTDCRERV